MGLFSKKEDIPEIPQAPTLATFPTPNQEKRDLPELPTFPSNSNNENLNREMVKSAVSEADYPVEGEVPSQEETPSAARGGLIPSAQEENQVVPPAPTQAIPEAPTPALKSNSAPIFVRVDKFQSAQKHFEEVKSKVREIEETLGKIKEIKSKEDEELDSWNAEIEKLKLRLSEVDSDIFSQI